MLNQFDYAFIKRADEQEKEKDWEIRKISKLLFDYNSRSKTPIENNMEDYESSMNNFSTLLDVNKHILGKIPKKSKKAFTK